MKIATKALLTLLIVSALTISSGSANVASASNDSDIDVKRSSKLERLQKHHDRKLELRASVLNMTPEALKQELKENSFDKVLKKHGFKTRHAFQIAVAGKAKDELKRRGWSENKLNKILQKKTERLKSKTN